MIAFLERKVELFSAVYSRTPVGKRTKMEAVPGSEVTCPVELHITGVI